MPHIQAIGKSRPVTGMSVNICVYCGLQIKATALAPTLLYFNMLCCAVLCCAVLCRAVPCCAVLCIAVLGLLRCQVKMHDETQA